MKNSLGKLFVSSAMVALWAAAPGYASEIYSQDSTTAPAAVVVGVSTIGPGNDLDYEEVGWADTGVMPAVDVSGGTMVLTGNSSISADTQAAIGIFLDTSGWTAGDYTWSFDIRDYAAGGGSFAMSCSLYEGNNDGTLSFRFGAADNPGTYPFEEPLGPSTFNLIGSTTAFSADGPVSVDFTWTEAGSAGDYLGLTWFVGETADEGGAEQC